MNSLKLCTLLGFSAGLMLSSGAAHADGVNFSAKQQYKTPQGSKYHKRVMHAVHVAAGGEKALQVPKKITPQRGNKLRTGTTTITQVTYHGGGTLSYFGKFNAKGLLSMGDSLLNTAARETAAVTRVAAIGPPNTIGNYIKSQQNARKKTVLKPTIKEFVVTAVQTNALQQVTGISVEPRPKALPADRTIQVNSR
ncbi:MAG: hypothetical protein JRH20_27130 [Deltaproteobacteria bacterium]|nr:hypothetical protein [Deltaproteobacteria bacterium]